MSPSGFQMSKHFSAALTQHVTRFSSQASAYVVVLVVDGQIAPGADRPRKSSLVHLHEPVVWIDRLWNGCRSVGNVGQATRGG
jgi:hypothetical protein